MEFRWVAAMTLWTVFSGPVFIDLAVSFRAMTMSRPAENSQAQHEHRHAAPGGQGATTSIQAYLALHQDEQ